MCGILIKTNQSNKEEFAEALKLLEHRGPDQTKITEVHGQGVFLGHTRLSILDLSHLGSQPMNFKGSGLELVFNGEVYNHRALKMRNHLEVISTGDTEVLFKLFQLKGEEMFKELDGEFAIVFYDKKKKVIYAARDPMGVKPLYYWIGKKGEIIISSEIKPILKFIGKFFNREVFDKFLTFGYLPGNETLFYGIKKIQPGTYMKFNVADGSHKFEKFFKLYIREGESDVIDVRNSVTRAVQKRMISDVPISVTLSGGIDSSIVAAIMAEHSTQVKSYSLGFEKESEELQKARLVSAYLGTDHEEMIITPEDAFKAIPDILRSMEEPMDKGSLIPSWFIGQMIGEKVTLIGEGADECFAGYNRHQEAAKQFLPFGRPSFSQYFKDYIQVFDRRYQPKFEEWDQQKNSILLYDLLTEIPDYHNPRVDKMFMASSVEARVPFLDPNVVLTALSVPYDKKINPEKKILREAFWDKLPDEILWRKKNALKIPYDEWIEKKEVKEVVTNSNLFGIGEMERVYAEPKDSRNRGRRIWLAYLITLWYKQNFSR